uniref:Uncharacterized protein n=1 Tax=Timema monikensis TaxID=170555 RepID=A0A7R9EKY2_9NEOP|nr:unnamed protein product [Timema monikensis]
MQPPMRMRVVLVVLLTGLDTCFALSCMAQVCVMTTCDPRVTKDRCVDGEFRIKGSVCHCCDICIPYKCTLCCRPGTHCTHYSNSRPSLPQTGIAQLGYTLSQRASAGS